MGNQKVRATTLQQKFGFQDDDLRTPAHDSLMVWLDQYVDSAVAGWYPAALTEDETNHLLVEAKQENEKRLHDVEKRMLDDRAWLDKHGSSIVTGITASIEKKYQDSLAEYERMKTYCESWNPGPPPNRTIRIVKTWESPVMARNDFMVGFIDMKVTVQHSDVRIEGGKWIESNPICIRSKDEYLFEIKPTIQSVGELIRQIRMYQQYQEGDYMVVSPDDRFASILNAQGIGFLKAPNL